MICSGIRNTFLYLIVLPKWRKSSMSISILVKKKQEKKVEKEDKKNINAINAVYDLLDKAYYVEAINFKIDNTLDDND